MNNEEIWVDVVGFPMYRISNRGNLYSKYRRKNMGHWTLKHKLYKRVFLRKDKKNYQEYIHRLVAIHFIPNPNNYPCVDHINGSALDNSVSNLRWCTHMQNAQNTKDRRVHNKSVSKYKGVGCTTKLKHSNKKWFARIRNNYKTIHSKCYENEIDAAKAYNDMAKKYHGEFATYNDI